MSFKPEAVEKCKRPARARRLKPGWVRYEFGVREADHSELQALAKRGGLSVLNLVRGCLILGQHVFEKNPAALRAVAENCSGNWTALDEPLPRRRVPTNPTNGTNGHSAENTELRPI